MSRASRHFRKQHRNASTLVELAVSTFMVGILMAASLTAAGQALLRQRKSADRVTARYLAESLLQEVLSKSYDEPGATLPLLGLDLLETLGLRSSYDDVDDYDGHVESPPKGTDGTTLSGYAGWSRSVQVSWLNQTTLATSGSANTGIKLVTVSASFGGVPVYSAQGCKTESP